MDEYIKRIDANYAVTDAIWHGKRSLHDVASAINSVPSADVAPVRHGHWDTGYFHDRVCSCCLHPDNDINDYAHSYCPNCGAKMDEPVGNSDRLEDDKR